MTVTKDHTALQFGLAFSPQHYPSQNPTRVFQRDLETITYAESLGFTEAWMGEHHSSGYETVGSPEVFLAAAIERTSRIRLGTGVASLPYHHPYHVAQRAVLLDHLSFGRTMLGVGPGSLPTDAAMLGIPWSETRARTEESIEAIHALLTSDEGVTRKTSWFTLEDAYLQVKPFQRPTPEIVFTSVESPFGPTLAGKYGGGLLSLGASSPRGFAALSNMWRIAEEQATLHGNVVHRKNYRAVAYMHIAETRKQAFAEVETGFPRYMEFIGRYSERNFAWVEQVIAEGQALNQTQDQIPSDEPHTVEQLIDGIKDAHLMLVGDVNDAKKFIQHMLDTSGGFGTLLVGSGTDWASQEATFRSLELISREVMPHFQDASRPLEVAAQRAEQTRDIRLAEQRASVDAASQRYVDSGGAVVG